MRENYLSGPQVWVFIDQYLWEHAPEHSPTVHEVYDEKLAAPEPQIAAIHVAT